MSGKPIFRFQAGPVSCAVWEAETLLYGQAKYLRKVSIGKRYQDKGGIWKTSTSFSQTEIPLAIYCLQQAFDFMVKGQPQPEPEVITIDD